MDGGYYMYCTNRIYCLMYYWFIVLWDASSQCSSAFDVVDTVEHSHRRLIVTYNSVL